MNSISIYNNAKAMTEQEYCKLFATLNDEEKKTHDSLVRLGDVKELAIATVLDIKTTTERVVSLHILR